MKSYFLIMFFLVSADFLYGLLPSQQGLVSTQRGHIEDFTVVVLDFSFRWFNLQSYSLK